MLEIPKSGSASTAASLPMEAQRASGDQSLQDRNDRQKGGNDEIMETGDLSSPFTTNIDRKVRCAGPTLCQGRAAQHPYIPRTRNGHGVRPRCTSGCPTRTTEQL